MFYSNRRVSHFMKSVDDGTSVSNRSQVVRRRRDTDGCVASRGLHYQSSNSSLSTILPIIRNISDIVMRYLLRFGLVRTKEATGYLHSYNTNHNASSEYTYNIMSLYHTIVSVQVNCLKCYFNHIFPL